MGSGLTKCGIVIPIESHKVKAVEPIYLSLELKPYDSILVLQPQEKKMITFLSKYGSKIALLSALLPVLVACSHSQVVEEKALSEKLAGYKHVVIEATASDQKAESLLGDLSSMMMKRLKKSNLFESVGVKNGAAGEGDLLIKGDIFDSTLPPKGF